MRVSSALGQVGLSQVGLGQLCQVISAWFEGTMFGPTLIILLHNGSIRKMKNKENMVSKKQ